MDEKYVRIIPFFGENNFNKIKKKKVLVFGLGGVGGILVEVLVRCGICNIGICDGDKIELSNFNRQIIATESTIGLSKVEAMKKRILDINPSTNIDAYDFFVDDKTIDNIDFNQYDLIIDCIDDVQAKVMIIEKAKSNNNYIISSMGTGNKSNPSEFKIANINQTSYCPLAKKLRYELRKKGINDVMVCYSSEIPLKNIDKIIASPMFVVASASMVIAKKAFELLTTFD